MKNGNRFISEYWASEDSPYLSNMWTTGIEKDPDRELSEARSLINLRMISSRMIKNTFLGAGLLQSYVNAIMSGDVTIKLHYPNKVIEKQLNETFAKKTKYLDVNEYMGFQQLLEMIISGSCEKGDILINMFYDDKLYVELIEANRIKTPVDLSPEELKFVREGVVYDKSERITHYYVKKLCNNSLTGMYVDSETRLSFEKIPVKDEKGKRLCYLFKAQINQRPNQSRQVPLLAPLSSLIRYTNQYLEAILISMKVSACFVAIFKTKNSVGTKENLENQNDGDFRTTPMEPGTVMFTDKEGDVSFASPNRPSDNADVFLKTLFMLCSFVLRIPYSQQFLDLNQANYSNFKGGNQETTRTCVRWHLALNEPLTWIIQTYLKIIAVQDLNFSLDKVRIDINFPKFDTLDEEKTARARKLELTNKTISPQYICRQTNVDYDLIQKENEEHEMLILEQQARRLKKQKDLEEELGISFLENPQVKAEVDLNNTQHGSKQDRITKKRPGEIPGSNLDPMDAAERRKTDGNW